MSKSPSHDLKIPRSMAAVEMHFFGERAPMTSNRNPNVPHIKLSIRLKQQAATNSQCTNRERSNPTSSDLK